MPLSARQLIRVMAGKTFAVPEGGWTAASFAAHGVQLLRVIVKASRLARMQATPVLARKANALFKSQLERVIARVTGAAGTRAAKANLLQVMLPNHGALWEQAIKDVFANAGIEAVTELVPPIQSTLAQGYSRTAMVLGQTADPARSPTFTRDSREIAKRVTRLDETTKKVLANKIKGAIDDGLTVAETVKEIRESVPEINARRALTIARTELQNAWAAGSAASFMESKTMTLVSVLGCEAREPKSPHFLNYGSTCNISDVPVALLPDLLATGWHP